MPVWTLGLELIIVGYKNFFPRDSIRINSNQLLCSVDRPQDKENGIQSIKLKIVFRLLIVGQNKLLLPLQQQWMCTYTSIVRN